MHNKKTNRKSQFVLLN